MPYNHNNQYRATIIRGKAQNELDNLLPTYANILSETCPCNKDEFPSKFNDKLREHFQNTDKKTLDNHRTEIAGKLFGMFYKDENGFIQISNRTLNLLKNLDQPAFFKDICAKYQFPSGMNKMTPTIVNQIKDGISIRQFSFLLKILLELDKDNIILNMKQIGYYILNSRDVLTSKSTPTEVVTTIKKDINLEIERECGGSSYDFQHIREQLNLLALANCIIIKNKDNIILNKKEISYIEKLAKSHNEPPEFDFKKYDLNNLSERKKALFDWGVYFSLDSFIDEELLKTSADALAITPPKESEGNFNKLEQGYEAEEYVYQLERKKIESEFPRLLNKIKKFGHIKGLGYDIQSVIGCGENPSFAKYIEVKSTKRVTKPTQKFVDSVNLTRNEWIAAQQHKEYFYIYRVYFHQTGIEIFVMQNIHKLDKDGKINAVPLNYRVDFDESSGIFVLDDEKI